MLNLEGIINRIEENEFQELSEKLLANKADKYNALLTYYRHGNISEKEMLKALEVNSNAFYVLKSRLFDKVQEYLLTQVEDPKEEIYRKVRSIPSMVYNTQPEIAVAVLTKLEKDLIANDMSYELTSVYAALKKLHLHTDKYYEYDMQYNKHVAFMLAIDKAEDLLQQFTVKLGQYDATRSEEHLQVIPLIKKEIHHICQINQSHHLEVIKNIIDISIALWLPLENSTLDDKPVEDMLDEIKEVFDKYPKDPKYKHMNIILDFFYFEYYHSLRLTKKEKDFFNAVNENLAYFMQFNHTVFVSRFFKSKIERYLELGIQDQLVKENEELLESYTPNYNDIPNFVNFQKYLSLSSYYAGDCKTANDHVKEIINNISFKNYAHSEVEIKLLQCYLYCNTDKQDLAWNMIRSINRKIRELNEHGDYENASTYIKMIKTHLSSKKANVEDKLFALKDKFNYLNRGKSQILYGIKIDNNFIAPLIH